MASTGNTQCDRCIHKDVCRYIAMIAEIKTKYSFVTNVGCSFHIRKTAAFKQAEASPEPETDTPPKDTPTKTASNKETMVEPAIHTSEKDSPNTDPYSNEDSCKDNKDKSKNTKGPSSIMDITVDKIGIREQEAIDALHRSGICTVNDVYAYQENHTWSDVKGLTKAHVDNLSSILQALNRPVLKPYDSRE